MTETIEFTPTWSSLLPAMLAVLENDGASYESKEAVREELTRCLNALDAIQGLMKEGRVQILPPSTAQEAV